jgi:aldehyde:ferredoxin oxidoreductase
LKAIAVRGHQRVQTLAYDPDGLLALGRRLAKEAQTNPLSWDLQQRGTHGAVEALNAVGILPTHNFHLGSFENVDNIKWEAYEKQLLTARRSCYACAVRCKREVAVDGQVSVYGGPEFETIAAFGSNCGVDDLHMINRANELCNKYMLDTISTGATIAFAMECFEHGLLGQEDTGGIDLRFGNAAALLPMIELIARRQGIGNLLAEGSKRAAEVIGGDALFFTLQVKGQELAMHDPRGKYNVGIGYAISEIGADHLVVPHDPLLANPESGSFKAARSLGITQAQSPRTLNEEKINQFFILERWTSMEKTVGFCFFGPAPRSFIHPDDVLAAINLATGWNIEMEEALSIGERGTNLGRVFNTREGFSSKDDTLPERFFQGLENGALQGHPMPRQEFQQALTRLYTLKGWDSKTGLPLPARLAELSLDWTVDMIEHSGPIDLVPTD